MNSELNDTFHGEKVFFDWQLEEWKKKRVFQIKLQIIIKEVIVFLVFLFFLYSVTFANISNSANRYNKQFISKFVQQLSPNETGLDQVILKYFLNILQLIFQKKIYFLKIPYPTSDIYFIWTPQFFTFI